MTNTPLSFFIIDDDPIFLELMTDFLVSDGHQVSSNYSAMLSLHEIKKTVPDCILVDLQMSEMDGLELCKEIRNNVDLSSIKIIFVSSHTDDLWKQRAQEAGSDGYITKPIDAKSFLATIHQVMK